MAQAICAICVICGRMRAERYGSVEALHCPLRFAKHRIPHCPRQFPRVGVLSAGMVASDEYCSIRKGTNSAVAELGTFTRRHPIPPARSPQPSLPGDVTKPDYDSNVSEEREFPGEPGTAMVQLVPGRLVAGRRAARGGRHVATPQLESVVAADRLSLAGETEPVKGLIQPVTARVTGEDAAGTVAAVSRRCEPDDEESRKRVAETRHRVAPVGPVTKLGLLFFRNSATVCPEPGAPFALDDGALQCLEGAAHLASASASSLRNRSACSDCPSESYAAARSWRAARMKLVAGSVCLIRMS